MSQPQSPNSSVSAATERIYSSTSVHSDRAAFRVTVQSGKSASLMALHENRAVLNSGLEEHSPFTQASTSV